MNPIEFEKILLQLLFFREKIREKIIPYFKIEVFDKFEHKEIAKAIAKHLNKYERFPRINEIKLAIENKDCYDILEEIEKNDIKDDYEDDFLLEKIEEFFKNKLIYHELIDGIEKIKNNEISTIGDITTNIDYAAGFTFNTNIGLDVFSKEGEEELFDAYHNHEKYIPSKIHSLDKRIDGGFHEKSLTIILGSTNIGKSLIMNGLATNILLNNHSILYVTLELSKHIMTKRFLANIFDININELKFLNKNQFHEQFEKVRRTIQQKLVIDEYPPVEFNARHLKVLLRELEQKKKFDPDIIFLDYIGIMESNGGKDENTYGKIKRICQEVRGVAVSTEKPIVSAVQTNRGGMESSSLDFSDIADSVGIATESDIVIGATQTKEQLDAGRYSFEILKNRYGMKKQRFQVGVEIEKMRLFDVEQDEPKNVENKVDSSVNTINLMIRTNKKEIRNKIIQFE